MTSYWEKHFNTIRKRETPAGGFTLQEQGHYRPDATAWAILAFRAAGIFPEEVGRAQDRLVKSQQPDGRVPLSPDLPKAYWPTPLAVLSWEGISRYESQKKIAVSFLLGAEGSHPPVDKNAPVDHNTALRGWSWTDGAHSWIEPTVLSVMALSAAGYGRHLRTKEAIDLIADRQLPSGGWNYGNRKVFGQELYPMPDMTGIALSALKGRVEERQVANSLAYLTKQVKQLDTPFSLGWGILGLSAWDKTPEEKTKLIMKCLDSKNRYGPDDTVSYCILLLSYLASAGLMNLQSETGKG